VSSASDILTSIDPASGLGQVVATLDSWGFAVADSRISVWTLVVATVVIIRALVLGRLAIRISCCILARMTRLDDARRLLAQKLISIAIWVLTALIAIDIIGVDLTALTVFSGAFGLALGFGLQKTFGNMLAGIILLMDRSIKPGDVIAVSDPTGRESFGQIRRIGIRAISVVTRDRKEYLIPNENLMVNQVVNWSYSSREVRVKAPVGVAYGTDLELAEKLLLEAAVGAPRVLSQPAPNVRLMAFGANAIEFEIRFWITDPEEGVSGARSEVLKRVWHLFKEHSIELPFPQLDLYLRDSKAFQQLAAAIAHRDAGSDEA
jgi:small-conductance mechanosensitive channel